MKTLLGHVLVFSKWLEKCSFMMLMEIFILLIKFCPTKPVTRCPDLTYLGTRMNWAGPFKKVPDIQDTQNAVYPLMNIPSTTTRHFTS